VAELILRTRDGAELYISGDGISVVDITLTKAMRFGDGTVLPLGSTVKALRVAPDLTAIDPPLADPADKAPMVYRYGLYVGTAAGWDWDVQDLWTVNPDTGPVRGMCGPKAVCVGPVMVAVNVCGVMAGSSAAPGGYLELEFTAADLASGQLLLFAPPAGRYILDIDLDVSQSFGCNVSIGTIGNPIAYAELIPADKDYTVHVRKVSNGDAIYLTSTVPVNIGGHGKATITLF
jgi:hypothetical protein